MGDVIDLRQHRRRKEASQYSYSATFTAAELQEFERKTGAKPKLYLNGRLIGEIVSVSGSAVDDR